MQDTISNQLIPIIEHDGKTAVNLRDLHEFLEVKRAFTHWANDMFAYGFTEGQDYVEVSLVKNDKQSRGGHNRKDYAVTLDMAKHVSMIQRTPKGWEAREYFINAEKQLQQHLVPRSLPEALRRYAQEVEDHEATRQELEVAKPQAEAWSTLAGAKGDYSVAEAAQLLTRDDQLSIGRNRLFNVMHEMGWLYRWGKRQSWRAYQDQVDNGRIVLRMAAAFQNQKTGEMERPAPTIRLTAKGVDAVRTYLLKQVAA